MMCLNSKISNSLSLFLGETCFFLTSQNVCAHNTSWHACIIYQDTSFLMNFLWHEVRLFSVSWFSRSGWLSFHAMETRHIMQNLFFLQNCHKTFKPCNTAQSPVSKGKSLLSPLSSGRTTYLSLANLSSNINVLSSIFVPTYKTILGWIRWCFLKCIMNLGLLAANLLEVVQKRIRRASSGS